MDFFVKKIIKNNKIYNRYYFISFFLKKKLLIYNKKYNVRHFKFIRKG